MQNKVLENLFQQGGLTLFTFPGETEFHGEALQNVALALNAGARFLLVDFSGKLISNSNGPISTQDLLSRPISKKELDQLNESSGWIISGGKSFPSSDDEFRSLYHNLKILHEAVPQVVGLLPAELKEEECRYIPLICRLLILGGNHVDEAAALIEDSPSLQQAQILWLLTKYPVSKRFPKAAKTLSKGSSKTKDILALTTPSGNWLNKPKETAEAIQTLHKISILEKNPLDGVPKQFKKFFFLFLIVAIAIPFFFVTKQDPSVSNTRNRTHERDIITTAPSFEYTFDGKETLQRIAKYGIGRFSAMLADDKMVKQYADITLDENGLSHESWTAASPTIPPAGTTLKFSRPDFFESSATDSIGAAWKYWTSIYSDSIAYFTEFYHENQTSTDRKHPAIDVAGKFGARILAPFSAKAWTSKDERGGIIIGLVHDKQVIVFMHCDKLLYLDGQEVMAGDPIATVGTSGHTSGPHAHIVTGVVNKNGAKRLGNIRYDVIDPIKWYYEFKPKSLK